jgi:hypothetical protein
MCAWGHQIVLLTAEKTATCKSLYLFCREFGYVNQVTESELMLAIYVKKNDMH